MAEFFNNLTEEGFKNLFMFVLFGVMGVIVLGSILMSALSEPFRALLSKQFSAATKVGFLTFFVIPVVLFGFGVFMAASSLQASIVFAHILFIILSILLPAGLYYYFIATRKESLLNNFLAILDRLGLFGLRGVRKSSAETIQKPETEFGRQKRVRSYFERFEALYGTLPDNFIAKAIEVTRPDGKYAQHAEIAETTPVSAPVSALLSVRNILPVACVMVLSFIGWIVTLPLTSAAVAPNTSYFVPNQTPVAFAFLGAYFFSLQLLIWRFVRKDLSPNAYLSVALRILLAMIGVWVINEGLELLQAAIDLKTRLVVAFAVGVFPVIVWQFIVGIVKRIPGIPWALPNLKNGLELSELDGLTIWHETRLEEEDIQNVANMASADIVDLLLNTRFAPNRIIDWVDQAILLSSIAAIDEEAVPKCRKRLEALGIRSATSLLQISGSPLLEQHNVRLGNDLSLKVSDWVHLLTGTLHTFPNLQLIQTWKGIEHHPLAWFSPAREHSSYENRPSPSGAPALVVNPSAAE